MLLNLRPKCANPSCAAVFQWLAGGKLFRFPDHSLEIALACGKDASAEGPHSVRHFWLCERCSNAYTVHYDQDQGVAVLPLWAELPAAESVVDFCPSPENSNDMEMVATGVSRPS